ncbi:MAG: hypothetical protein Q7S44_02200 [bacterium]|nr:hypothetical protein [bacterium]
MTSGFYREDWPVIYKDKILWVAEGIIYVYDVKEKTTVPFFEGTQPLTNFYALIAYDGRYLVYASLSDLNSYDVRVYDLNKKEDIAVTDRLGSQMPTDFDNDIMLYIDGYACGKLFAYDLRNGNEKLLIDTSCGAKISDNTVVSIYGSALLYSRN